MHFAWALATAALMVATPLRAVALDRGVPAHATSVRSAATTTGSPVAFGAVAAPTPAPATLETAFGSANETGGGWNEIICAGCVGVATYALFSGGITMLPVMLANPELVGTLTGACLVACRSVITEMLK
jgi:hypothetical protein